MTDAVTKRFYIGGLARDVSAEEIAERFSRFGKVSNLSLKSRTDNEGNHIKTFAHLDIEADEAKIKKCFDTYQNTKWKGSVLKLQFAKESFIERLAKEREEKDTTVPTENPLPVKAPDKSDIKGPAVPGTPVPGKPDWVVAKYGRVLPVLKLKKSYKIKGVKYDPSKHCHAAKVFKDESDPVTTEPSCDNITWELNIPDSEMTKKRKGEFPVDTRPVKRHVPSVCLSNTTSVPTSVTSQSASFNVTQSPFNSVTGERKNLYKKENDELEIVKLGQDHKQSWKPLHKSNKFDSDIESDLETNIIETVKKNNNQHLTKKIKDGGEKQATLIDLNTSTLEIEVNCQNSSVKKAETNIKKILSPKSVTNNIVTNVIGQSSQEFVHSNVSSPDKTLLKSPHSEEIPHKISPHLSTEKLPAGNNKTNDFTGDDAPSLIPEFRGLSMLPDFASPQKADQNKALVITSPVPLDAIKNKTSKPEASHILSSNDSPKLVSKENLNSNNESDKYYDSASSADTDEIISRHKKKHQINSKATASSGSLSDVPSTPASSSLTAPKALNNSHSLIENYYLSEYSPGSISDYSLPNSTPALKTDKSSYDSDLDSNESSYDSDLDSNDFELVVKKLAQKAKAVASEKRNKPLKSELRKIDEKVSERHETSPLPDLSSPKQINCVLFDKKEKIQSTANILEKSNRQDMPLDKNKHSTDNEKRLIAIREKMKLKEQQKSIMQKALQKVDLNENSGSRIVFNSDSESRASSESDQDDSQHLNVKSKNKKNQPLTLFENSSGDDSDGEALFESKPHFEGKKGEKLMKLERKIGDSRFKLDAKFAESDSGEDSEEEKPEAMDKDESLEKEKTASLKVLENVIGKSTLNRFTEKLKRNTKHLIDMNAVRFDPTKVLPQKEVKVNDDKVLPPLKNKEKKQEKVAQLVSPQMSVVCDNKEEKVKRNKEVKISEQKEVNSLMKEQPTESKQIKEREKHQVMEKSDGTEIVESSVKSKVILSSSLVNLFKSKNDEAAQDKDNTKTFSLLEQFDKDDNIQHGTVQSDKSSEEKDDDKGPLSGLFKNINRNETNIGITKEKEAQLQKQLLEDSNDDLSELDQEVDPEEDSSTVQQASMENKAENHLREAGRINIRYSKEQWLQRWEELRPTIVKMYKRKHKEALKSKRVDNEMKRKKEFLKNAKKGHWTRKR